MNTTTIPTCKDISQRLFSYFLSNYSFTKEEIQKILAEIQFVTIKKGKTFLEEGKTCRRLGILFNGLLYSYYGTDKENVSRFFYLPKNPIVVSFDSFKNQRESNETIKALEDSHLVFFSYDSLNRLYQTIPKMERIGRELAEESYSQALERIHSLQSLNTKERFINFFRENSELLNRVNRQLIASYLGMNRNLISQYLKEVKM